MSELISGKEALIALANGEDVEVKKANMWNSCAISRATAVEYFINDSYEFRIKPRTINLNNNELPKPISIAWGDPHRTAVELDFKNEDEAHEFYRLFSSLFYKRSSDHINT